MMALTFEITEYEALIERTRAAMREAHLDLLLLFHQESLYYLFGYDQIGYWVYQTVVLPADGSAPTAICRRADELMIRESRFIKEIRPRIDDSHVNTGAFTVYILREHHGPSGTDV